MFINRRVFPTIPHLLLPLRSLLIIVIFSTIFLVSSLWVPYLSGFSTPTRERNSRSEVLRTFKNPSHWGELVTSFYVFLTSAINIKIIQKICVLSCLLHGWRKTSFYLLLNVFLCIDQDFCSIYLDQLTADLKIRNIPKEGFFALLGIY